jgi:hypothetical protein
MGRFRVSSHSISAARAAEIGIAAVRGNTAPVVPLKIRSTSGSGRFGLNEFAIGISVGRSLVTRQAQPKLWGESACGAGERLPGEL